MKAVRLLTFSDIHNDLVGIKRLRAAEENSFDAIIIAGDIGSGNLAEFLSIVSSFDCPAYIVFGNWDYDTAYDLKLPANVHLIHHSVFRLGHLFVTGYSGCPSHWGMNPLYLSKRADLQDKFAHVIDAQNALLERRNSLREQLIAQFPTEPKRKDAAQKSQNARALKQSKSQIDKALREAQKEVENWYVSSDCRALQAAIDAAGREVLQEHRDKMRSALKAADAKPSNTVIVTHERLYRLNEDFAAPLLHCFGHRHKFQHTMFKGTHYLNSGPLDSRLFGIEHGKRVGLSGYCRVVITGTTVSIERNSLQQERKAAHQE